MKNTTKTTSILAAIVFVFSVAVNADDITVSNPAGPPSGNVAIANPNYDGSLQIQGRFRASNSSDWRSITQTFTWPTNLWMDGLQLRLGNSQPTWTIDDPYNGYRNGTQEYTLVVQALNSSSVPTSLVAQLFFTLTSDKIAPDTWIYFDLDSNLNLSQNQLYGFELTPSGPPSKDYRTYFNTSTNDYAGGRGAQANPQSSNLPRTTAYGSAGTDYTMYFTAIPEPATIILFSFALIGLLTRKK